MAVVLDTNDFRAEISTYQVHYSAAATGSFVPLIAHRVPSVPAPQPVFEAAPYEARWTLDGDGRLSCDWRAAA